MLLSIATLVVALNVPAADKQTQTKGDIEDRIREVNRLDNKGAEKNAGLRAVSDELAIPVPTLQAQLKSHPNLGIGGLVAANTIAQATKKDADTLIKAHGEGRGWAVVARNNGVSVDTIESKLTNVENAMKGRSRVRERTGNQQTTTQETKSAVDQHVASINQLDNTSAVKDAGLRAVSKELAIPVPTLQTQLQSHPDLGVAGLYVANSIAQTSKKDVDTIIKAHEGHTWADVARDNGVNLDTVESKLSSIESSMKESK
jgi:hypothetical protein